MIYYLRYSSSHYCLSYRPSMFYTNRHSDGPWDEDVRRTILTWDNWCYGSLNQKFRSTHAGFQEHSRWQWQTGDVTNQLFYKLKYSVEHDVHFFECSSSLVASCLVWFADPSSFHCRPWSQDCEPITKAKLQRTLTVLLYFCLNPLVVSVVASYRNFIANIGKEYPVHCGVVNSTLWKISIHSQR